MTSLRAVRRWPARLAPPHTERIVIDLERALGRADVRLFERHEKEIDMSDFLKNAEKAAREIEALAKGAWDQLERISELARELAASVEANGQDETLYEATGLTMAADAAWYVVGQVEKHAWILAEQAKDAATEESPTAEK